MLRPQVQPKNSALAGKVLIALLCASLLGCGGGTSSKQDTGQKPDPVTVDLPIAYIKRPIPVDENENPVFPEVRDPTAFNPGAAIYVKERATALTTPVNITDAAFDAGAQYDVKDLSVSPDGKKLLFAMHAPLLEDVDDEDQPKWHIWEYNLATKLLRPLITSEIVAEQGHDLSPRYLPDGRILFSSTRQIRSKAILLDEGKPQFSALEEGGDEAAFVLHTMKDDGSDIQQITYNQSHDLQPAVLQNGKIFYTRWDQRGEDRLSFYTANADGTQVERHYGFYSLNGDTPMGTPANRLFRPQETLDGRIVAILKPDGALLGGDMVVIDTKHFFEQDLQIPAGGGTGSNAQASISTLPININVGENQFSRHGRYAALTPLYDGTNRLLVSWSECRLIEPSAAKRLVPCTDAWLATPGVEEADPIYGIWVYDITKQTQQPVVLAEEGVMFSEPVSLEPRTAPTYVAPKVDADLAAQSVGMLHIRSVYDMDGTFNGYGSGFTSIEQITQAAPDQRPARFVRLIKPVSIPDDETADNFADNSYGELFNNTRNLYEILGYAPVEPDGSIKVKVPADVAFTLEILDKNGKRISGRHNNWLQVRPGEVRECNGCHNAVNVNSGHGRSDAEVASLNKGAPTAAQFTNTVRYDALGTPVLPNMGETMAEFAGRSTFCLIAGDPATCAPFSVKAKNLNPRAPSVDLIFDDEWTNPAVRPKAPSFAYRYQALAPNPTDIHLPTSESCSEPDGWTSLCRIVINYENHVQPLWERSRQLLDANQQLVADNTCVLCHTSTDAEGNPLSKVPDGQLELLRTKAAANAMMLSYTELTGTTNRQILDENGVLTTQIPVCELAPKDLYPEIAACTVTLDINGAPTCEGVANCPFEQDAVTNALLLDALGNPIPRTVTIGIPRSMTPGSARSSARFFDRFTTFDAARDTVDHRGMLNNSELKLLFEWLDIGGRYYNNPFDSIAQ
jgi:hypothetical protein